MFCYHFFAQFKYSVLFAKGMMFAILKHIVVTFIENKLNYLS